MQVKLNNSLLSTAPDFIIFDEVASEVTFEPTESADVGTYNILMLFTLSEHNLVTQTVAFFSVEVLDSCAESNELVVGVASEAVYEQTYLVRESVPITAVFPTVTD